MYKNGSLISSPLIEVRSKKIVVDGKNSIEEQTAQTSSQWFGSKLVHATPNNKTLIKPRTCCWSTSSFHMWRKPSSLIENRERYKQCHKMPTNLETTSTVIPPLDLKSIPQQSENEYSTTQRTWTVRGKVCSLLFTLCLSHAAIYHVGFRCAQVLVFTGVST